MLVLFHIILEIPFCLLRTARAHRMCPFRMTQRTPCALFLNAPPASFPGCGKPSPPPPAYKPFGEKRIGALFSILLMFTLTFFSFKKSLIAARTEFYVCIAKNRTITQVIVKRRPMTPDIKAEA